MDHNELDAAKRRLRLLKSEWDEADKRLECIQEEVIAIELKQRARAEEFHKTSREVERHVSEEIGVPATIDGELGGYGDRWSKDSYSPGKFRQLGELVERRERDRYREPPKELVVLNDVLDIRRYSDDERGYAESAYNALIYLGRRYSNEEILDRCVAFLAHKFRVIREERKP